MKIAFGWPGAADVARSCPARNSQTPSSNDLASACPSEPANRLLFVREAFSAMGSIAITGSGCPRPRTVQFASSSWPVCLKSVKQNSHPRNGTRFLRIFQFGIQRAPVQTNLLPTSRDRAAEQSENTHGSIPKDGCGSNCNHPSFFFRIDRAGTARSWWTLRPLGVLCSGSAGSDREGERPCDGSR